MTATRRRLRQLTRCGQRTGGTGKSLAPIAVLAAIGLGVTLLATPAPATISYPTPGTLSGASDSVLDALARGLQLDEAETAHLFDLARTANASPGARSPAPRRMPCVRASSVFWMP